MSYVLHYPLLLPIENQIDENGATLTAEHAAEALRALADKLEANPGMLSNTIGREPVASMVEDRWVIRALGKANIIRAADGGWIDITSGYVAAEHTRSSQEIVERNLDPGLAGVWVRPEDAGGAVIPITLRGRYANVLGIIDAREWMVASDREIVAQIRDAGWNFAEALRHAHEADLDEPSVLRDDPNRMRAERCGPIWYAGIDVEWQARAESFLKEVRPDVLEIDAATEAPSCP